MFQARWFFRVLLADTAPQGLVWAIWTANDSLTERFAVADPDAAAAYAVERSGDSDTYITVSLQSDTLTDPRRRGGVADAKAIFGFWADVDVAEPGKDKAAPPTLDAAREVLDEFPLAPSLTVRSGGGLHAWWLLPQPWVFADAAERQRAGQLSRGFQQRLRDLLHERGWGLDHTADIAHLLRPPGTVNHKQRDNPRPVRLHDPQRPRRYPLGELAQVAAPFVTRPTPPPRPGPALPRRDGAPAQPSGGTGLSPQGATRAAMHAQIARLADTPETDTDARPRWYALAAVRQEVQRLARTPEGDRNNQLNRAAFAAGQLAEPAGLPLDALEDLLQRVALSSGLEPDEVVRTTQSGLTAGLTQPRDLSFLHSPTPALPPGDPSYPDAFDEGHDDSDWDDGLARLHPGGEWLFDWDPDADIPLLGQGDQILHSSGEATMIVSRTGVGKSTFAQQYARRRLGLEPTPLVGLPVQPLEDDQVLLYLAADRPRQIRRSMLRMMTPHEREMLDQRLVVWEGPLPFLLNTEPLALLTFIEEVEQQRGRRVGEIVVDSLKDVALELAKDEGGSAVAQAINQVIASGRDLLVLHHQRKSEKGATNAPAHIDDVYGSMHLVACQGNVIYLDGKPGAHAMRLLHLKQSADVVGPLDLLHNHDTGTVDLDRPKDLLGFVRQSPNGVTVKDVCGFLFDEDDPDRDTTEKARRKLQRLVDDGTVRRSGTDGGFRQATRYYATQDTDS